MEKVKYPQFVVYSGFSGSGKSTTMNPALEELGYEIVSTSKILHDFTEILIENLTGAKIDTYDRRENEYTFSVHSLISGVRSKTISTARRLLIIVAENCLVKVFGREIFALCATKKFVKAQEEGTKIAFECIGGDEYNCFSNQLNWCVKSQLVKLHITRDTENPEADSREKIPTSIDIQNNSTREDFKEKLDAVLKAEYIKREIVVVPGD